MTVDIGHVESIFRDPVKSMRGERMNSANIGWHRIDGDRRLAFRRTLYEAPEIAHAQGATMFELRSSLSLADVSAREGRAAARDVLARFPEPEPWPEIVAARALWTTSGRR